MDSVIVLSNLLPGRIRGVPCKTALAVETTMKQRAGSRSAAVVDGIPLNISRGGAICDFTRCHCVRSSILSTL